MEEDEYPDDMGPAVAGAGYAVFGDGDGSDDAKEQAPIPEWAVPVKRTDDVGLLAWQLVGEDGAAPDLSVIPALVDSLVEDGDHETALKLRKGAAKLVGSLHEAIRNDSRNVPRLIRRAVSRAVADVPHLHYELNSVVRVLMTALDAPVKKQNVEVISVLPSGETVVRVEWANGYVGQHIRLDDGRGAVVIGVESDEFCRAIIN